MALGRLRTPAPIMAVTVWKVEYHHLARREGPFSTHFCSDWTSCYSRTCKKIRDFIYTLECVGS